MVWPLFKEGGYKNVLIHTDSLEVVKALQVNCLANSSLTLIKIIHLILQIVEH